MNFKVNNKSKETILLEEAVELLKKYKSKICNGCGSEWVAATDKTTMWLIPDGTAQYEIDKFLKQIKNEQ